MDTMEITKIVGGVCGALLILLLGKWAAETIYHVGDSGHGGDHAQAYTIEVASDDNGGGDEAEAEGPSLEELLASADISKGEKVFKKCAACHALADGENKTGPHLYAIVGRATGAVAGYDYSGPLAELGTEWSVAELDAFLAKPKDYLAGTKMNFGGLKKSADRANLIAYLQTIGG